MAYQTIFERYEIKYILTIEQKNILLDVMKHHMAPDEYGRHTIRNVYFDTNDYRLIRHSLEKPEYKEKIRVRSYSQATKESTVFVELKKKYKGIVYKRRVSLPEKEAMDWLAGTGHCSFTNQITDEVDYLLDFYGTIHPTAFLSYEREAYYSKEDSSFRVTFDNNILCRVEDISLCSEIYGISLLNDELCLMEIKCSGGIPLWMSKVLSEEGIFKSSFSKYGTAYEKIIYPKLSEVKLL